MTTDGSSLARPTFSPALSRLLLCPSHNPMPTSAFPGQLAPPTSLWNRQVLLAATGPKYRRHIRQTVPRFLLHSRHPLGRRSIVFADSIPAASMQKIEYRWRNL